MGYIKTQILASKKLSINRSEYKFNLNENIDRLIQQIDGDPALLYLSIFAFIEGYFRDKDPSYDFDARNKDRNGKTWMLYSILSDQIFKITHNSNYSIIESTSIKENLETLQDLGCVSDDGINGSPAHNYYISADRIRHTFTKIKNESLITALDKFVEFAEYYHFKDDRFLKLQKTKYHSDRENHNLSEDTRNLMTENQVHQNALKILENDIDLRKKFEELEEKLSKAESLNISLQNANNELNDKLNSSQDKETIEKLSNQIANLNKEITNLNSQIENDTKEEEIGEKLIDLLFHKEQLEENQNLLSLWSKSWRDYNKQMFELTEEQIQILENIKTDIKNDIHSNYLIQGGPGTGKTIILIHLLNEFLNTDIQLLTYTSSLNKYNKYVTLKLFKEEAILEKIDTFDHFLQNKAEKILNKEIYIPNQNDFTDKYSTQLKEKIDILRQNDKYQYLKKTASYILNEAINEIWSLLPNEANYRTMYYCTGKEITNLNELAERQLIWNLVKDLESVLEGEKVIPLEYACYKLTLSDTNIDNNYKNNYVLVDEIQDLSKAKIKAISKLIKKNYIISGDLSQSVFIRKALSWSQVALFVKETREVVNEKALKKNFRSSASIQELANTFLDNVIIKDKNIYSEGFMPGPTPDYTISDNQKDSLEAIKKRIKLLKEKLYFSNKDFCIIASNKDELQEIKTILGEEFPSKEMEDNDFKFDDNDDSIRLSTVKFIKGIDCPVVLLYLSNNYLEKETNGNMDKNTQMNGLYACITRAMNILSIFINNSANLLNSNNSISKLYNSLEIIGIKN